jgi:hypothetical protein
MIQSHLESRLFLVESIYRSYNNFITILRHQVLPNVLHLHVKLSAVGVQPCSHLHSRVPWIVNLSRMGQFAGMRGARIRIGLKLPTAFESFELRDILFVLADSRLDKS